MLSYLRACASAYKEKIQIGGGLMKLFHTYKENELTKEAPLWLLIAEFLIGFIGLQLISLLIQMIIVNTSLTEPQYEPLLLPLINLLTYGITFGILLACFFCCIQKAFSKLIKELKSADTYIWAAVTFFAIITFQIVMNFILSFFTFTSNENQDGINSMVLNQPVMCFFFVVIFGPIVEELTYRFGLASFLAKKNKILGIILPAIIFGFIHFSWEWIKPFNLSLLLNELANLPIYIGCGLIFGFFYLREGKISVTILAHMAMNLYSFLQILAINLIK